MPSDKILNTCRIGDPDKVKIGMWASYFDLRGIFKIKTQDELDEVVSEMRENIDELSSMETQADIYDRTNGLDWIVFENYDDIYAYLKKEEPDSNEPPFLLELV